MARARPKTDLYLGAVGRAVDCPGQWVEVRRHFESEFNAEKTASCLQEGYLRVEPEKGDTPLVVEGKRYIATPAPVTPRVSADLEGGWKLEIRFEGG